jgi:hypothetical protein
MATFALVSEGITDQIVLEKMIHTICSEMFDEGVDINPLQPLRDATDRATSAPHGGWELVLEYCDDKVGDALATNDYVVIHLDTDQGDHPNFGLGLTHQGADRPYDDLVADAVKIIADRLGNELYNAYADRLVFAIAVHTMESWLLLYLYGRDEPKKSLERLNRRLIRDNKDVLTKEASAYLRVARDIKRKPLLELSNTKSSLGVFVVRLSTLK